MPRSGLTGSRIRERRIVVGIKQTQLARAVGVSPAYLNLIEHNRRTIGGKLLVDLARELGVEVGALTGGAQAPLIGALQHAATNARAEDPVPEADRVEEFAGRFPGWAALIGRQNDTIDTLERQVEAMSDRMAHDPFLSKALHEVLSVATAIRATAGILRGAQDLDRDWQARFHRNLYEDSERLSEGSTALVQYLDTMDQTDASSGGPLEEFDAWLAERHHVFGDIPDNGLFADGAPKSIAARQLAVGWSERAQSDGAALPMDLVRGVLTTFGPDPARLARAGGVDLATAMRRLAFLPHEEGMPSAGIVVCDASGAITLRKPVGGLAPPRFGAACPLWPLYQALLRPMVPVRRLIELKGQPVRRFWAYAICLPREPHAFDAPEVVEATMLFVPEDDARQSGGASEALPVGTGCRVCSIANCDARREPALIGQPQETTDTDAQERL